MAGAAHIEILAQPTYQTATRLGAVGRAARKNPAGAVAGIVCILLVVLGILGPSLSPYSANNIDFVRLQAPSLSHPFGTNHLSRDMFSRIIYGSRNSLGTALRASALRPG